MQKKEEELCRQRIKDNRKRLNSVNGMRNKRYVDRKQNKEGRFYNTGTKTNDVKGSKSDVWKKKEVNEGRYNKHKNKGQEKNEKVQSEEEVDMIKYFKDKWEIDRQKEAEEMNGDIEDVLEVNSGIAKELNTEEVIVETHLKPSKISKASGIAFGGWDWVSNSIHSTNGRILDLVDCVNDIEVEDVNCSRLLFTWIKSPYKPETSIMKKLDRVMANFEFLDKYGGGHARFHYFLISYHCPVVMHIPNSLEGKKKSFRFSNFIADKKEFTNVKLEDELKKAQVDVEANPNNIEIKKKMSRILHHYNEAITDEEKLLAQKAKVKWLSEGDKNTKYFHNVVTSRMHLNRIMGICDDQRNWLEGENVADQIFKHFEIFLSNNGETDQIDSSDGLFSNKLSKNEAKFMVRDISDAEVKEAIFGIGDDKASCPDGFTAVLQGCLEKLVNINQSAFVPERLIQDNLLITQELLKGYNRKIGPQRCALKIDIAKAYDTVN
ncbi:hypothetical protein Tco_0435753 [Tanacetum coccineum]